MGTRVDSFGKDSIFLGSLMSLLYRLVKSAITNIPIVGGPLVELIDFVIPESKAERLINFVADLAVDIDRVKDRINTDFVKTEEFAYLFEQTFKSVYENYQKEKINAFRALLVNSLVKSEVAAEQKELFLNTLRNLTVIHLRFLVMFNDPKKHLADNDLKLSENIMMSGTIKALQECFPLYNEDQIRLVVNDLYNSGLIKMDPDSLGAIATWGIHMLEGRLTSFGKAFTEFITQPT